MSYKKKQKEKKASRKQAEQQRCTPVPARAEETVKEPGAKERARLPRAKPDEAYLTFRSFIPRGADVETFSVDFTQILGRKVLVFTSREELQEMLRLFQEKLAEKGRESILLEADNTCRNLSRMLKNPMPNNPEWNMGVYMACTITATTMKLMYNQTAYGKAQDGKTFVDLFASSPSVAVHSTSRPAAVADTNNNAIMRNSNNPTLNPPDVSLVPIASSSTPAVITHPDAQLNNAAVATDSVIQVSSPAAPADDDDHPSPATSNTPSRMTSFRSATATATSWLRRVFTKTTQAVKRAAAITAVLLGTQSGWEKYLTVILM